MIMRPLRPGYHAGSHLDPWKAVAGKKQQQPATGAAAVAERRQDGGEESKGQN